MSEPKGIFAEDAGTYTAHERVENRRIPVTQSHTLARYQSGGRVVKYRVGKYNTKDIADLENIAKIRAKKEGVTIQILPSFDSPQDPNYAKLFPELIGTEYEGKCPDFRIITRVGDKELVEYESYSRPYNSKKIFRMLSRGSEQAPRIIIDTRDMNVSDSYLKGKVEDLLKQKSFNKKIVEVSRYDGHSTRKIYG